MLLLSPFHRWSNWGTKKLRKCLLFSKLSWWQSQIFNSGSLVPETALNLSAALKVFISSLLGLCTIVISFFIHVFSVFVFFSLCHYAVAEGARVLESPGLICSSQNIAISILQIRKTKVQRCHVTCYGVILSKLCLCISGFFVCKIGIIIILYRVVVMNKWTFMRMYILETSQLLVSFTSSPFLYCTEFS